MSEGYEVLQKIGAQKIHENTHISLSHVQAFLNEGFDDMTKIQFLGFISILEREYGIELDELKEKALIHFEEIAKEKNAEVKVFVSPKRKRNLTSIYIGIVVVIFITFIFMSINSSETEVAEVIKVDNTVIETAKSTISTDIVELNSSTTEIDTFNQGTIKDPQADSAIVSFTIIPKVKVWLGYVDLDTHKKYQRTFKDEFSLDPKKDWILAFGHGHVDIEINGIVKKYKLRRNVRFSYINGELKEISLKEFKDLNKGSKW